MKRRLLALALVAMPMLACGPSTPEAANPEGTTTETPPTTTAVPTATPEAAPTATPTAAPKAEPSPEELKKAKAAQELAADRAKWEAEAKAEDTRFTPEIHAEAKKLAEAKYASLDAALKAVLAGKHRVPKNLERDKYRHPTETLKFFGLTPKLTVLEYGPGEGWWTELLAPTLATQGKLLVTTTDPKGPADARSTFYGQRLARFLDRSPELYSKVDRIVIDGKNPKFGLENKVDLVIVMRSLHGLHRDKLLPGFLGEAFKALKPGGVLGIEQHRAKADADPDKSAEQGYLPEAFVIKQAEAAGFKLEGKSEVNANPKDTKDYPEGVWTLPPTLELGDKDKDKYMAIGESDRMTLKFVKPKK
ncbi:class I SAM-dependent methyltransferase [Polyangium fumosum]|uniref:class I SAM-dependent methyltransferase n=1 Tax=Polyangium fumosum TaxID=889272 RepID=UPI001B86940E|nr:methyltransferase domain-containing protein [Polyangium fumosum]